MKISHPRKESRELETQSLRLENGYVLNDVVLGGLDR